MEWKKNGYEIISLLVILDWQIQAKSFRMGHQPEVRLTLYKSDPHCCEITFENGKIYITDRIKMPLSSYLSRQFWSWLMIWNFCGLGVHTAASCLRLCSPQSPTHGKSVKKMQANALSNPQRSPFPPLKYFQNCISISPIANSFTLLGFNKLHSFFKMTLNTSKRQEHFPLIKKERSRKQTDLFWRGNQENCFRFSTEILFL